MCNRFLTTLCLVLYFAEIFFMCSLNVSVRFNVITRHLGFFWCCSVSPLKLTFTLSDLPGLRIVIISYKSPKFMKSSCTRSLLGLHPVMNSLLTLREMLFLAVPNTILTKRLYVYESGLGLSQQI